MFRLAPLLLFALTAATPAPVTPDPESARRIKADVATLASDAFGGRGPGEAGEAKTIAFLADAMAKAGLKPGGPGGSWLQDVPLVRLDRSPGATLTLTFAGTARPLVLGRDATLALRKPGRTEVTDLPLVFAGFGIAGSFGGKAYDNFKGVDMAGKVAVVLANDPDFEAGQDLGFEGRRLVVAGRVGSKFEAAARAGAAGVLVIHEDAAASYPWGQVGNGDALQAMIAAPPQASAMVPPPLKPSAMQLTGWLSGDAAAALLKAAKHDLANLKTISRDPNFKAFALPGASLSARGDLTATPFTSHNVVGRLDGRNAETIVYGAHWDANGTTRSADAGGGATQNGPDSKSDAIRNGAIDNATGTAELLEVARLFAAGPRPQRSLVFAAWTSEEKGLLGADHYAAHPVVPLASTVAYINLDPHVALPTARNLELIGSGRSQMEDYLKRAAARLSLRVDDEPNPEAGWFFRSDQLPFARRGVPVLAFRAGRDLVSGGLAQGSAIVDAYNTRDYHQPSDAFRPEWDFGGSAQEAAAAFLVGTEIANSTTWPAWYAGTEYAPLRAPK